MIRPTLNEMLHNSEELLPGVYHRAVLDPNEYSVHNQKTVPMLGMHTLIVSADVVYADHDSNHVTLQFLNADQPLSDDSCALVRCTCKSYYHFFAAANGIRHVQFGSRKKRYIPVPFDQLVHPPRRAPKNPNKIPGMCKHAWVLVKALKVQSLIM